MLELQRSQTEDRETCDVLEGNASMPAKPRAEKDIMNAVLGTRSGYVWRAG